MENIKSSSDFYSKAGGIALFLFWNNILARWLYFFLGILFIIFMGGIFPSYWEKITEAMASLYFWEVVISKSSECFTTLEIIIATLLIQLILPKKG